MEGQANRSTIGYASVEPNVVIDMADKDVYDLLKDDELEEDIEEEE